MKEPKNNKVKNVYAFIDSQNVNVGVISKKWKLDWGKFRLFLRNKYSVKKAFLFIGYVESNSKLYADLQEVGFLLIFKNVLAIEKDGKTTYKGNVDAELVLHSMIQYKNYDKAIIVSGDGDFYCLVEYLETQNKLAKVITPNSRYSSLLKKYSGYIVDLFTFKEKLGYKKERHSRGKQG
ncbi:MAG TPA: NYN domain-containing protein [Candidatus Dojkabacteria bacterium]|nr:NYN domain-containing protein [Candidatus Dojkabacteria bacterium]